MKLLKCSQFLHSIDMSLILILAKLQLYSKERLLWDLSLLTVVRVKAFAGRLVLLSFVQVASLHQRWLWTWDLHQRLLRSVWLLCAVSAADESQRQSDSQWRFYCPAYILLDSYILLDLPSEVDVCFSLGIVISIQNVFAFFPITPISFRNSYWISCNFLSV